MVHTFKCLNRFFMLDVESGSVFEIDELTCNIVDKMNSPDGLAVGEFFGFSKDEYEETTAELTALINEGILFSDELPHKKIEYSGVIKAMCLNISHDCNLRCGYCFASGGSYQGEKSNMSFDTAKAAIDFLILKSAHRHNLEVDFFGGEPLLNLDVVKKTVAYARSLEKQNDKNFKFTITTNALKLDDDAIEFFNREMQNVVVSIDGRKNVHNEMRKTINGKPSFDLIIDNALNFRKKRGDRQYYIRGTFTRNNLDFSEDVLFLNDLGFDQISVEPVVLKDEDSLSIRSEDIPLLQEEYEKLAKAYLERRKTDKWFNFFHFNVNLESAPCEAKRLVGCGAGNEYIAVNPNGDIYPCHQFDGENPYKLGNVLNGTFDTNLPKTFALSNVTTKPMCNGCWAKYFCSGGCNANAIHFNGNINLPYESSCGLMRKRIECALAINSIEKEY